MWTAAAVKVLGGALPLDGGEDGFTGWITTSSPTARSDSVALAPSLV